MKFNSRQAVKSAVEDEGLGYFISDYASSDMMPDEELARAFETCRQALSRFEKLLSEEPLCRGGDNSK